VRAASEEGRLLVVPGWSWTGAVRTPVVRHAGRPEPRVAARAMAGRDELVFEGARLVIVPAWSWATFAQRDAFQVVSQELAGPILQRMGAASVGDQRAALVEAATLLSETRSPRPRGGLFLIRRREVLAPAVGSRLEATLAPPAAAKALAGTASQDLLFEYRTNTGHPISDDDGFELVAPDGGVEVGTLSNGRLYKPGVDAGSYELRFREMCGARWSVPLAHPFGEVRMEVETCGFPPGTTVRFAVWFADGPPDGPPLAELSAALYADRAAASWRYQQAVGGPVRERLRFEAAIGKKRAWSDALAIEPHAAETALGAQERLRALGYDPGPPEAGSGDRLAQVLRAYQQDHPPLAVTGRLDDETAALLDEQLA
jgi:hypothetical protein